MSSSGRVTSFEEEAATVAEAFAKIADTGSSANEFANPAVVRYPEVVSPNADRTSLWWLTRSGAPASEAGIDLCAR